MPEEDFYWFEWQANNLAGLILVPPNQLRDHFDMVVLDADNRGLPRDILFSEVGKPFVLDELSNVFEVSSDVMRSDYTRTDFGTFPLHRPDRRQFREDSDYSQVSVDEVCKWLANRQAFSFPKQLPFKHLS